MKPRIPWWLLAITLLTTVSPAAAQQPKKVPRVGYMTITSTGQERHEAFRQSLRELGYVEGKNIVIEWRYEEEKPDHRRTLAAELVRLKVDVIVAVGSADIRAAKEASVTVPIVMIGGGDAVGSGLVASLARPGGNLTGLSTLRPELSGKRLELLKEIIPKLSRVAVFASSALSADYAQVSKEVDLAAGAFGVKVQHVDLVAPRDIEAGFRAAVKERADAILFRVPGSLMNFQRKKIAELAVKSRLPVVYERAAEVEAGGLMSYGVNVPDLHRRAATYVDKILKGAKPVDLPVEQPTKFELVINLKAAKQIALTVPPNVLARADRVIVKRET